MFANGRTSVGFKHFFGYDRGPNGEFIINEEQVVTVRYIYKRYLEELSTYKIATELTAMGVKTPVGKDKWHSSSVMSILKNENYKGDAILQKTFTKDFLSHKSVVNNGEVPQYYVEGHHEGIVTAEQYEQVQAEIIRRQGMGKYSGVGLFSSMIKCGECGSWYGSKVWHSTDKYRKVIYRCNNKYADGCKCKTPHITEEEIKQLFIKVANELFSEKDEILANTKVIMEMVCNTDDLDKNLQDYITELNIILEQMEISISENSWVVLNQDELLNKYNTCCLCKVENPSLLIASHIKPWAISSSDEKLDADNGFLLCPNHDTLFDGGYISFDDAGQIIISDRLSTKDCTFTNVNPSMKIALTPKNRECLKHHREKVFK